MKRHITKAPLEDSHLLILAWIEGAQRVTLPSSFRTCLTKASPVVGTVKIQTPRLLEIEIQDICRDLG